MEWQGCLNVLRGNKYACEENTLCIADTIILNAQTMCVSLSLCVCGNGLVDVTITIWGVVELEMGLQQKVF
jgi:hypothetical protein